MEAIESIDLNKEVIFSSSNPNISRKIVKLTDDGVLRKIAPRLYTTNLLDSPENIVRRNLLDILAWRFPKAVISHRSAYEMHPTDSGDFFMTDSSKRKITDLPGIIVNIKEGPGVLESDISFSGITISSDYRRTLENLQTTRAGAGERRTFSRAFIEERLERIIISSGEKGLNKFRDEARQVAQQLHMEKEFALLNTIISALLNTHSINALQSDVAKARAIGVPFDGKRGELFETLYENLQDRFFVERRDRNSDESSFRLFSFFESYFSNYIEGTKFKVNEAKQIIETGATLPKRVKDSHDMLGTFAVLSNRHEMNKTPADIDELYSLLQYRHRILMREREDCNPGIFKDRNNQAGNTTFVEFSLVKGTLKYGFRFYQLLKEPLAKAIYMMFMISEVHPFIDGNGRIARIMMNAELVKGEQSRIIVPTVFREDYLLALRKLSRQQNPDTYIRIMEKLHHFSDNLYGQDFDELNRYLQSTNAYEEPSAAKLQWTDRQFSSNQSDILL